MAGAASQQLLVFAPPRPKPASRTCEEQGKTGKGKTGHDRARQGKARQGRTRQDKHSKEGEGR